VFETGKEEKIKENLQEKFDSVNAPLYEGMEYACI
jgi:hypothetical protein